MTNLATSVTDRRRVTMRLTWTVPSSGSMVAGYEIRYAKVPITAANFDDPSVTVAAPFTGTPASPGQADGVNVSPLYIETDYYFAVAAKLPLAPGARLSRRRRPFGPRSWSRSFQV